MLYHEIFQTAYFANMRLLGYSDEMASIMLGWVSFSPKTTLEATLITNEAIRNNR